MERNDPFAQYNFVIEIDDVTVAGFTEVGGLGTETDIIEYREGTDLNRMRKMPGLTKYNNITLKRGMTLNRELWEWRKTTLDGLTSRRQGAIILRDESGADQLRWEFYEGWVSKYEGPAMNSTANEAAIETIEIVSEEVVLVA
jgi:phage tail-like protein